MESVSKIYKHVNPGIPLSQWLTKEKGLYERKATNGLIDRERISFDEWLNERHKKKFMSADATVGESLKTILNQTAEKLNPTPAPTNTPVVRKTILGMKPVVFYTIVFSGLAITGILIYKKVKANG